MADSQRGAKSKGSKEPEATVYWQWKVSAEEWWLVALGVWTACALFTITYAVYFNATYGWRGRFFSPFMISNLGLVLVWVLCCPVMGMKGVWYCIIKRKQSGSPAQEKNKERHIKRLCCIAVTWATVKRGAATRKPKSESRPAVTKMIRESVPLSPRTTGKMLRKNAKPPAGTQTATISAKGQFDIGAIKKMGDADKAAAAGKTQAKSPTR